jgi:sugar/nucleoside kinase (ribokinase family)
MTMGERGILTYRGAADRQEFFIVDSFADHVVDAVGAGDALLSYSSLAFYVTGSEAIASILGSIAAAVACEREGNIPVTPEDVMGKLASIEKMTEGSRTSIDRTVVR